MVTNRSAPKATVVPILVYEDVGKALEFLTRAFGFKERLRAEYGGSIAHAQMDVGECSIMMGKQGGRARAAGAVILKEPEDMPFGVRQYTAKDIGGHWWTFSQNIRDVDPAEWGARLAT